MQPIQEDLQSNVVILKFMNAYVHKIRIDKDPISKDLNKFMVKQLHKIPFLHVPWILRRCTDAILSGDVESGQPLFSASFKKKLSKFPELSPLEASNIIKRFILELPHPLLPVDPTSSPALTEIARGEDASAQRLAPISSAVRRTSRFSQAALKEICYVAHQLTDRGKCQLDDLAMQLAPIIGKMDTEEDRKKLCALLIAHFRTIFAHIDCLRAGKAIASCSDGIAIPVFSLMGASLSLELKKNSTAQYLSRKLQSVTKSTEEIYLYQVLDRQIRRVDPSEIVSEICGTWVGSIIYSNQKIEISESSMVVDGDVGTISHIENVDNSLEQMINEYSKTTSDINQSSTGSVSDVKESPRSKRKSIPLQKNPSGNILMGIGSARSNASLSLSSIAEFKGSMKVSLYNEVSPKTSTRDWKKTGEGEVKLSCYEGILFMQILSKTKNYSIKEKDLFSTHDSSIHFVFQEEKSNPIGFGFTNRSQAGYFRQNIYKLKNTKSLTNN